MATLIKPKLRSGINPLVKPKKGGMEYLKFSVLQLARGKSYAGKTGSDECVGVLLSGQCELKTDTISKTSIGERRNVFDGAAWSFYLSGGSSYQIKATETTSIALIFAPAKEQIPSYLIPPSDVVVMTRGTSNWCRDIHNIVGPERPASRLLVGETFNRPGCWSGTPPHCHDRDNYPEEVDLEEIYYFKLNPSNGFGVQVIYTDDRSTDEAYVIRDDYATVIPEGYHPVVGAAGYEIYYLWMLAGEGRGMIPRDDPDHAWLHSCETALKHA